MSKNLFCAQAFGSAAINSSGEYISCCNIRTSEWKYSNNISHLDPKDRINQENLREVRRGLIQGVWPKVCENCKQAEENDVRSMREIWNQELAHCDIPAEEFIDPNHIRYLDLTFSTKCNSKCMTCNPSSSDFWEDEYNTIFNTKFNAMNRTAIDTNTAEKLVEQFPNVERISFIGGEPTISDEHINYLKTLINNKISNNIKISYVTNLTGVTDELIELWRNFRHVHVAVSVDGYKEVNEYIRYPFKWNKVEQNIRKFFKMVEQSNIDRTKTEFTISLSCTVSLFNAIQCFDLLNFWFDLTTEYKSQNQSLANNVGCFVNYVSIPEFATVDLLSQEYRNLGIVKANALLEKIVNFENQTKEQVNEGLKDSIRLVISWLNLPQKVNSTLVQDNKNFITKSDLYRNRHIQNYIPELYDELEKLWES